MKKIRLVISLFCLGLALSGCKWIMNMNKPFSSLTNMTIPEGTPIFQKGFRDGCGNAFYTRGNGFYRARYGYRFDGNLAGNTEYRFGISRGYTYCFAYIVGPSAGGPQAPPDRFLNYSDSTYMGNTNTVNSSWGGFFEGGGTWNDSVAIGGNTIDGIFDVYQKGISGGTAFNTGEGGVIWGGNSRGQFFGQ